jgi:imidazolonepropionase-like amidohydrolase
MSSVSVWKTSFQGVIAAVSLVAVATPVKAQPVAIVNARILSVGKAGDIPHGVVVFDRGRIIAVGADVQVPTGARVIDGRGRTVTPGFIASETGLGLTEINSVRQTDDTRSNSADLSAAFDVARGLNPASAAIPVARLGGVAHAVAIPRYDDRNADRERPFAGQAALISLDGGVDHILPRIAMTLDLGESGAARMGGARGAEFDLLEAQLDEVKLYADNRAAYDRGALRELSLSAADLEALIPVVRGQQLVLVSVSRASDIRQALTFAKARGLKIALTGAEEAWMAADEIAAAGVPVILNPTTNLPLSYETLGATLRNAALLHKAGVRIAFTGNDATHRVRELRYNAGIAVAHGLPYEAALAAITLNPARILGLDARLGSLDVGKRADVVVWSGDPLEPLSQAEVMFIGGVEQDLAASRPMLLRDKYLTRERQRGEGGQ